MFPSKFDDTTENERITEKKKNLSASRPFQTLLNRHFGESSKHSPGQMLIRRRDLVAEKRTKRTEMAFALIKRRRRSDVTPATEKKDDNLDYLRKRGVGLPWLAQREGAKASSQLHGGRWRLRIKQMTLAAFCGNGNFCRVSPPPPCQYLEVEVHGLYTLKVAAIGVPKKSTLIIVIVIAVVINGCSCKAI